MTHKITTCLWFDYQAEEAARFYTSVFRDSKIENINYYGGEEGKCGWLKDRYGLSWQVIPDSLSKLMADPARAERVTRAFLQMNKLDIGMLQKA